MHEAILRVIRHLEKVRMIPRDEVLYYLVTVTETASIDLYRKRQRESRATIGNENDWAEHLTDDNTAEQAMLRLEQRELLERCLAHLPQREIDLLNYYYILELPYKEIARLTGLTAENARMIVCRAKKRCWQPTVRREEKQMSKYPLDQNDMQEQYEDLLIKAALKEHARKESARLEQEAAGEAAVPPAEDNVIRAAFRRVTWEEARGTVLYGAKKR